VINAQKTPAVREWRVERGLVNSRVLQTRSTGGIKSSRVPKAKSPCRYLSPYMLICVVTRIIGIVAISYGDCVAVVGALIGKFGDQPTLWSSVGIAFSGGTALNALLFFLIYFGWKRIWKSRQADSTFSSSPTGASRASADRRSRFCCLFEIVLYHAISSAASAFTQRRREQISKAERSR
jgi:hypothetical protein